jgi:hypothetical protein
VDANMKRFKELKAMLAEEDAHAATPDK